MENLIIWGTLVNTGAVIVGALLGGLLFFLANRRLANMKLKLKIEEVSSVVIKALGFPALLIGIQGALKGQKILVIILSIAIGAFIGGLLDLDKLINSLGNKIEEKMKRNKNGISAGFVNGTLMFCVGAMVINGALESGLGRGHSIFYAKAVVDGVMACLMSVVYGPVGLLLTAGSVFLLQGSLTYVAEWVHPFLSDIVINEMGAVGSLLIIGIGLNMLGATKLKIMNYTPAIFLPILFCMFL